MLVCYNLYRWYLIERIFFYKTVNVLPAIYLDNKMGSESENFIESMTQAKIKPETIDIFVKDGIEDLLLVQ